MVSAAASEPIGRWPCLPQAFIGRGPSAASLRCHATVSSRTRETDWLSRRLDVGRYMDVSENTPSHDDQDPSLPIHQS